MICEGTSLGCDNQQHYAVNLWKESLGPKWRNQPIVDKSSLQ
jgi:hypothetical protein